jgi:hypothetical protein
MATMGNAFLYIGIMCVCSGFLMPLGLIFLAMYFYGDYTSKYKEVIVREQPEPEYEQSDLSEKERDRLI